tara:strand:+ start:437 stop:658 length:222 start_codon:yes stop_codon:yes gene_type:complete
MVDFIKGLADEIFKEFKRIEVLPITQYGSTKQRFYQLQSRKISKHDRNFNLKPLRNFFRERPVKKFLLRSERR